MPVWQDLEPYAGASGISASKVAGQVIMALRLGVSSISISIASHVAPRKSPEQVTCLEDFNANVEPLASAGVYPYGLEKNLPFKSDCQRSPCNVFCKPRSETSSFHLGAEGSNSRIKRLFFTKLGCGHMLLSSEKRFPAGMRC